MIVTRGRPSVSRIRYARHAGCGCQFLQTKDDERFVADIGVKGRSRGNPAFGSLPCPQKSEHFMLLRLF